MKVSEFITVLNMPKKDQEIYTVQINEEGKIYWLDFYVEKERMVR